MGRVGVQVEDRGADLGDDLVELLDVLGDPRRRGRGLGQPLGAVQGQADPEQPPDDMFVQVPGDPVPVGQHLQLPWRVWLSARCRASPAWSAKVASNSNSSSSNAADVDGAPPAAPRPGRHRRPAASPGPARTPPQPRGHVERQPVTFRGTWSAEHRARGGPGDRDPAAADQLSVGPTLTATVSSRSGPVGAACRGRWAARSASSPRRSARPPGRRSTATRCRRRSRPAVAR